MINTYEKELIVAYFQGGNATGILSPSVLGEMLEEIKESVRESKVKRENDGATFNYPQNNPAR